MEPSRNSRRLSGRSVENLSRKIIKGLSGASKRGRSDAYCTPDVSITMRCFAGAVRRFVARFTGVEDDLTTTFPPAATLRSGEVLWPAYIQAGKGL